MHGVVVSRGLTRGDRLVQCLAKKVSNNLGNRRGRLVMLLFVSGATVP